MYAKIKTCGYMTDLLRYHELKQRQGTAYCVYANRMVKDADKLSFEDMRYQFKRMNELNYRVGKNMLSVILSFDNRDIMTDAAMVTIARDYMERMRLNDRMYVVFRHRDTSNPHMHLLASRIQADGKNLYLERKDYSYSGKITRELDEKYQLTQLKALVVNEDWMRKRPIQRVEYGNKNQVQGLVRVLKGVIGQYRYQSLEELNAVLAPYNVEAFRGSEGSRVNRHGGLYYRMVQWTHSNYPWLVKASLLPGKPTLKVLEKEFDENAVLSLKDEYRLRVKVAVDKALFRKELDLEALRKQLVPERIGLVLNRNKEGVLNEVFYVDHLNKTVYSGQSLGKGYDIAGLQQRTVSTEALKENQPIQELNQRQHPHHTIRSQLS